MEVVIHKFVTSGHPSFAFSNAGEQKDLHDTRVALYERCIAFDRPDIYDTSLPLQGAVLAARVKNVCKDIVQHV